jgi:hypothetical protein
MEGSMLMVGASSKRVLVLGCLCAGFLLVPHMARAQSAIAGLVTDTTGAAMPGVTVEAASPALIEGSRSAITDGQGRYNVDNLRPGTYKVTFTLAGFSTLVREGVELVSNFTAPIDVQLRVGEIEESITVTGASPLVDVTRTATQQVMTRDVLDTLPTGRNAWNVGVTLPGVTSNQQAAGAGATGVDVGGLGGAQQLYLSIHGSKTGDGHNEVDGMNVTCVATASQCNYFDDGAFQELNYQTIGGTAESQLSGVIVNMIPRDGGNTFKGSGVAVYSNSDLFSSNYTPDLLARGLRNPGSLLKIWDYNAGVGGPIQKNRLWFYGSYRNWGTDKLLPQTFNQPGVTASPQYSYYSLLRSYFARLTGQVSQNNKVAAFYAFMPRDRPRMMVSGGATIPGVDGSALLKGRNLAPYMGGIKWTSTLSNRSLVELGYSTNELAYYVTYNDQTAPGTITKMDTVLGTQWFAGLNDTLSKLGPYQHLTGKWSYVTGSQSIKAGTVYSWGRQGSEIRLNGGIYEQYSNGRPFQVQVWNTPTNSQNNLVGEVSFFVQDSWRVGRFTLNGGIRYDYIKQEVPPQSAPAGEFVPARNFAKVSVPTWSNWSPRLGVAYDVFGSGRTAIKGSWGVYIAQDATSFAGRYNPMAATSELRTWNPVNNPVNLVAIGPPPLSEIGPSPAGASFGLTGATRRPGPDVVRGQNQLYNVTLQHQLFERAAVSASFYHRRYDNFLWTDNVKTTFADYTRIEIPNPYVPGTTIPVQNIRPDRIGAAFTDLVDFTSSDNEEIYNGFDATMTLRLARSANLTAGVASGLSLTSTCEVDDPNQLLFCNQKDYKIPWNKQFKLSGAYTIPRVGVSASAVIQSTPGLMRTITYVVSRAVIPSLTLSSVTVPLNEPGTLYLQRLNLLDLKFSKTFTYRTTRLQPNVAIFNVTNSAAIIQMNNRFGPSLNQVQQIVDGRFVRFGMQVDF